MVKFFRNSVPNAPRLAVKTLPKGRGGRMVLVWAGPLFILVNS